MPLHPMREVPGTLGGEVAGLAVAVDAGEPLATVTLAGEILDLTAAECRAAAELLLDAAAALTGWAPPHPPAPAAGQPPTPAAGG